MTINNNNTIREITGLDSIETKIMFEDMRRRKPCSYKIDGSNSVDVRIMQNIEARNKCIQFLNKQYLPYNIIDIQELTVEALGGTSSDTTFLYPIPENKEKPCDVYFIWESVEFEKARATHIFKCNTNEVEEQIDKIKDFLQSKIHIRSLLNQTDPESLEIKKDLKYFGRINHDATKYSVWENRILEMFPFLQI